MTATALPAELGTRHGEAFVGRDAERAALQANWRRALSGERRLVLIAGEPGIGKTRLVGEVASELLDSGAVVLHGRCDPDVVFPYQPIAEVLAQLLHRGDDELDAFAARSGGLAHVVPTLATRATSALSDGGAERAALFAATTALFRFAARRAPMLVVIDDAHWATRPTLQLVGHVIRSTVNTGLLLAVTYRDTEVRPGTPLGEWLADLHNEAGVERLTLGGLDDAAVLELVGAAGAEAGAGVVDRLQRDTGGNPFFLTEMVRHLADSGDALPAPVRDVVALRVGLLPDATRQHLAVAAIIGPRFDLELLGSVGLEGDSLDAIEPAVRARLVIEIPEMVGQFAFAHELIRQALIDDLGPTRVSRWNEHVGHALEQLGDERRAAAIARHYLVSARSELVDKGARWALLAASSGTWRAAPEATIELTDAALDALAQIADRDAVLEVDLLIEKAMALLVLQRNLEFLAVTAQAVAVARRSGSQRALALAVSTRACYTPTGTTDPTFISDIEEALAVVEDDQLALRSRLYSGLSVAILVTLDDRQVAYDHAVRAAALADESGSFFDRWMSRFAAGLAAFCEPDTTALERMGDELQALGAEFADENTMCHGLKASASARFIHGDLDHYVATMAECESRWAAIHNQWGVGYGVTARFIDAAVRGRFAEAEAAVDELVPLMANDPNFAAVYVGEMLLLRILQGRRSEFEAFIASSIATYPEVIELQVHHAMCRFEQGDHASALATCRGLLTQPGLMNRDFGQLSRMGAAVEPAVAVGERDLLARLLEALLPYEDQLLVVNTGIGMAGAVNRYLGAAAGALGDLERADRWFASSLAWDEAHGCRPLAAWTQAWWAAAIADHDPARAVPLLDNAITLTDELEIVSVGVQARDLRSRITSGL